MQLALFSPLLMDNTTPTPLDAELIPNGDNTPPMATQIEPPSSITNGHTSPIGAEYGDGAIPADLNASITGKGDGKGGWTPGFRARTSPERALKWERHFTEAGQDPFDTLQWEMRTAGITGEDGKSVFEQTDCEIPKPWSQLATNVVVSKYFRGPINSPERETSVKQVIGRVADTIGLWGMQGGYFATDEDAESFRDELAYLLVHQYGAFNSPVWFNLGVKGAKQQASACQPYDALVSTPAGLIPIGELVERNAVGHAVYDANGIARIVATKHNGRKEVLRLHLKSGYTLDVTADHLVWKRVSYANGRPTGKWVEAGTLQANDALAWHRTPVVDKLQELPAEVAEAALAGWLQSDGFVGRYDHGTNRSLTIEAITVNAAEEKWVRAALNAVFPDAHSHTRAVTTQDEKLDCQRIRIYGDFMEPFIGKWDLMTRGNAMTVPPMLYTAPLPVVVAYLRSLFQAEGYVSVRTNARIGFDMVSEGIVRGVQSLLGRLGIYARARFKQDARADRQGCWCLSIYSRGDRELFAQEIGFIAPDKQAKVIESLLLEGHEVSECKTMQIERIEVRGELDVYDIQTTSGEYLSNGIRVHNCFINDVYDDMESIMELAATEARLFKGGSGAGVNLWRIRSSREQLRGGGIASGPISFMRGWDAFAGAVKSGGTCLAPYQRVYTAQGPVPVVELAQREEFVALSFDPPANRYKAKRARAWLAGRKEVVRVTTDKGAFELSFDHPVKLSSGEYVQAGSLAEGMSLFACTIDTQHGHLRVGLRDGQKGKEFLHRLVAADVMGQELDGLVVHHRDGDRLNNAPENLQVMTQAEHAALHGREVAARGEHTFQTQEFSHAGADNGMHRDGAFWGSEAAVAYRETQGQILKESGRAGEMQHEAARQKTLNTAFRVLNAGWQIDTFEHYVTGRKLTIGRIASIAGLREQIEAEFGSYDEFVREVARANHRVQSVEVVGEMDVYDVEVQCPTADDKSPQTGHNFLIWDGDEPTGSGVVVANTRRAAKMVILNVDHPDIGEFITCKADEEKKAWALIEAGYNGGFNVPGGAYDSVDFQNANHSVRVTDEFMRAAENDGEWRLRAVTTGKVIETKKAREMLKDIAQTTWICGDPGMQFDTIINDWHTCANTDRIYASNPCCITGDTLVGVADGRNAVAIKDLVGSEVPVYAHDHATGRTTISRMWNIEVKRRDVPVFRVALDDGSSFRATDDHLIMLRDGSYRMVRDLKIDDSLMPFHSKVLAPAKNRTRRRYIWNGATWAPQYRTIWNYFNGEQPAEHHIHHADFDALNDAIENLLLMPADEHNALHIGKMTGDNNPARRLMNDDWRAAISRAVSGENNPNYGKTHSDETRAQMRARAAARWENPAQHAEASERASEWMARAKAEGRPVGRRPKACVERCCPICRDNFQTPREAQIFCSDNCRLSPQGRAMTDAKRVAAISGRPLSAEHRAKLSQAVSAASDSSQKREAAYAGQRKCALRAARLLMDQNIEPTFDNWSEQRQIAAELGATRVPTAAQLSSLFESEIAFREGAALWNHKVVSVEFCGNEDVYDGTVDVHHNFAILTSADQSCEASAQNFSGIFIHNSEFMFLNSTACNLASLNLLKFYDMETGVFDAKAYSRACETFLTAQEIIVSFASYPTEKIGEMSEQYRPLGLGYANLGALLMAKGLAYDSDEGRALAGALTAIMTGAGYRKSAQIARNTGPFEGYADNKEPMLRVIAKHRDAVSKIDATLVAENVMQEARNVWDDAYMTGQKYGYRNSQATVLAPTGCLVAGSLVSTDKGLVRLARLGNPDGAQWQDADFRVYTDGGVQSATKFFINGMEQTRIITTQAGYSIQGTGKHRVKVVNAETGVWQWKHFRDIEAGDLLPLAMNTLIGEPQTVTLPPLGELHWNGEWNTRVPAQVSAELAELVGYFMGDGSLHSKGLRFCVAQGDDDVAARLADLGRELFGLEAHLSQQKGYTEVALHSVSLAHWWDAAGFTKAKPNQEHAGKGYVPCVPDAILHSNDAAVYGAFLRGLFEADGTNTLGVPAVATAHKAFADEIRSLLLTLGFPTSSKVDTSQWGNADLHVQRLRNGSYNPRWLSAIGFMGARKTAGVVELKGALSGKRDRVFLPREVWEELVPMGHPLRNAMVIALKRHGGVARQLAAQIHAQTGDPRVAHVLDYFFNEVESNQDGGEQMTYDLSVPANVTYVANGFVSHNTISFMMDCDTTGVEPDIALVKYKKLVGGGLLKIVNQTVPAALRNLGYDEGEIKSIVEYIDKNDTIEGAPGLDDDHLPVFDCAFKAMNGTRSIHHMGHIKMMAATQPFISGAISKTVNMPQDCTADEIYDAYLQAWKLGVKAVAIYRDGSKRTQPLSTASDAQKAEKAEKKEGEVRRAARRKLPDERNSITHKFSIAGQEGYFMVGLYEDGSPGEIFIKMSKEGSTISGLMDSFAVAVSMCLQYGVPLRVLVNKFSHTRFEPSGYTTNRDIPIAKSLMDYIFRWFDLKFHPNGDNGHVGKVEAAPAALPEASLFGAESNGGNHGNVGNAQREVSQMQQDAPPCPDCGALTVRSGACYKCNECGATTGCG